MLVVATPKERALEVLENDSKHKTIDSRMIELCGKSNMHSQHEWTIPYSACISQVFNFANFANLESLVKFIELKFEPLHCHIHGQHKFAKFFQRIPSKQLSAKI